MVSLCKIWKIFTPEIRPKTEEFLEKISKLFELHIVTFGARMYAHTIAEFLDPGKKYFSHRILSRQNYEINLIFNFDQELIKVHFIRLK